MTGAVTIDSLHAIPSAHDTTAPACQAARAQVHRHSPGLSLPLVLAALLALLLLTLAVRLAH